ncbi:MULTISPECIES: DUF4123 domain-containing protein [unclassified Pseudomonas]|uniref:DUF4123 domain-containing protein n=1 Tax=unclassified Pseudomonas TaxID=196821 RepID=UPI002AC8D8DC|nr:MULTISPECIES: DUF4123 domain-containing protein [unclassified Pseudomonas]MEB0047701.1 DUF4123 domain-containing protein [Pseudomonas sp. Dout3]MEB0094613.1 DUF4123 domain-containing protein [Pseudomonas sp. DC1.2]WPX60016.1 DUF4123 domain-containing protein [Pseudomonas sp. DC1.2]
MNTWCLLERPAPLLKNLYALATHPLTHALFSTTALNSYAEQSPLLVKLNDQPTLRQAIQQSPAEWPGLVIESTHDTASVLKHLRHILFVHFDRQRKGVLRYSNPTVARYFFAACTAQDLGRWLGPINRLSGFGETWAARAVGDTSWRDLNNPDAGNWTEEHITGALHLSADQEQALTRQRSEQFLYGWWQQHPHLSYSHAWEVMSQALVQGIDDPADLRTFLSAHCPAAQR